MDRGNSYYKLPKVVPPQTTGSDVITDAPAAESPESPPDVVTSPGHSPVSETPKSSPRISTSSPERCVTTTGTSDSPAGWGAAVPDSPVTNNIHYVIAHVDI